MTSPEEVLCAECGKPIGPDETKAYGRNEVLHYRCFKRGMAHGRKVAMVRCDNCGAQRPENNSCFQCGVGPRIG